jgi:hypothetical protein
MLQSFCSLSYYFTITIICKYNNNHDDSRLHDQILLLKIPMGTRKNFYKIIDSLGKHSQKDSPALT